MVEDDLRLLQSRHLFYFLNGILQVTDPVDEMIFQGLIGGVDPPVRKSQDIFPVQFSPVFRYGIDKTFVKGINGFLKDPLLFFRRRAERGAEILQYSGLDRSIGNTDLSEQFMEVELLQDDSDTAGDARRLGEDPVGGHGHIIPPGGRDVVHLRHNGNLLLFLETSDLLIDRIGSGHRTAGTVDPQDHPFDPPVPGCLAEFFLHIPEESDGRRKGFICRYVIQESRNVEEKDFVPSLPLDDGLL